MDGFGERRDERAPTLDEDPSRIGAGAEDCRREAEVLRGDSVPFTLEDIVVVRHTFLRVGIVELGAPLNNSSTFQFSTHLEVKFPLLKWSGHLEFSFSFAPDCSPSTFSFTSLGMVPLAAR